MFITAIAIGATPSSMNAGSVQTPSGRSNVDERRAAATRPDVRASRRLRSASARSRSAIGTPALADRVRMPSMRSRDAFVGAVSVAR